jgi:uncharacterized protein (DUF2461 family)
MIRRTLTGCLAGGLWMPEAQYLTALRSEIDRRAHRLKQALHSTDLRREFLEGAADEDDEVVERFVAQNSETALKTKPKVSEYS